MKELKYKIMLKIIRKLRAFLNGSLQKFIKENHGAEERNLQNFINIVYL